MGIAETAEAVIGHDRVLRCGRNTTKGAGASVCGSGTGSYGGGCRVSSAEYGDEKPLLEGFEHYREGERMTVSTSLPKSGAGSLRQRVLGVV